MILDTNAVSRFADGDPLIAPLVMGSSSIELPVIVLGEYRFGIRQSRRWESYEKWLDVFVTQCRILAVDEQTTLHYADIRGELKRSGKPIPANDLWIAALSRQYNLPVLSRDTHFEYVPSIRRITW